MKLTKTEKIILKNTDEKYKYIARDEWGGLYVYTLEPYKKISKNQLGCWSNHMEVANLFVFNHLFQDIKWEDEKPYKFR